LTVKRPGVTRFSHLPWFMVVVAVRTRYGVDQ
jgi:hypothetical protein